MKVRIALARRALGDPARESRRRRRVQAQRHTVWLQRDAQSNWPEAVAAANEAFAQKHPGVNVKVEDQTWGDYKTKFEATLAAATGPT